MVCRILFDVLSYNILSATVLHQDDTDWQTEYDFEFGEETLECWVVSVAIYQCNSSFMPGLSEIHLNLSWYVKLTRHTFHTIIIV